MAKESSMVILPVIQLRTSASMGNKTRNICNTGNNILKYQGHCQSNSTQGNTQEFSLFLKFVQIMETWFSLTVALYLQNYYNLEEKQGVYSLRTRQAEHF